jgi:hypothetical protein
LLDPLFFDGSLSSATSTSSRLIYPWWTLRNLDATAHLGPFVGSSRGYAMTSFSRPTMEVEKSKSCDDIVTNNMQLKELQD